MTNKMGVICPFHNVGRQGNGILTVSTPWAKHENHDHEEPSAASPRGLRVNTPTTAERPVSCRGATIDEPMEYKAEDAMLGQGTVGPDPGSPVYDVVAAPASSPAATAPRASDEPGSAIALWRAPVEAQTSGSVVRNAMVLLPVDDNVKLAQGGSVEIFVESSEQKSSVSTALEVGFTPATRRPSSVLAAATARPLSASVATENTAITQRQEKNLSVKQEVSRDDVGLQRENAQNDSQEAAKSAETQNEEEAKITHDSITYNMHNAEAGTGSIIPVAAKDDGVNGMPSSSATDCIYPRMLNEQGNGAGQQFVLTGSAVEPGEIPAVQAEGVSDETVVKQEVTPKAYIMQHMEISLQSIEVQNTEFAAAKGAAEDPRQGKDGGAILDQNESQHVPPPTYWNSAGHVTSEAKGGTKGNQDVNTFFPSPSFAEGKPGYVFKLGDRGLGFYINGYIGRPRKLLCAREPRPWNAGPGDEAIRRAPMGPVPKPFKKITTLLKRKQERDKIAEESDTRPFMARMVAQENSRGFQSTLLNRENVLDAHILALLKKFSDPTFFKKKHGYNVHGQMLGKDGKMIVKLPVEKTEEEKAQLSWYRKVYEDRLGKHLPSKRLGDSIEARREAYAYSRHFTAELNAREDDLNKSLSTALKGVTKLEFVTEDYHYPGAYDTDGKVILEKGTPASNELHQTEEQEDRACSFAFKAIQRYRAAHEDIVSAIAKKDKALQKMLKKTNLAILQEIAEEAVTSSGMGIHRQKTSGGNGSGHGGPGTDSSREAAGGPTESPEQLRDKFSQSLKAQIKSKDNALMKEVAGIDETDAEQMIFDLGQGVEIFPGSWRQDEDNLNHMQRRRKELMSEIEADSRKVVCPWKPGGLHIAHEPWKPFIPRDQRPPVRSASEGQSATGNGMANAQAREPACAKGAGEGRSTRGSVGGGAGSAGGVRVPRRPHTAPTPRRREFLGRISTRARRVLATQPPGTPLHSAFATYSTDPFPVESVQRKQAQLVGRAVGDFSIPRIPGSPDATHARCDDCEGRQCALTELLGSTTQSMGGNKRSPRPQSAALEASRLVNVPKRRPATASGTPIPGGAKGEIKSRPSAAEQVLDSSIRYVTDAPRSGVTLNGQRDKDQSSDLRLQGGAGVTVLWARLCGPSDVVYKKAVRPPRPKSSVATRNGQRKDRASRSGAPQSPAVVAHAHSVKKEQELSEANGTTHGSDDDENKQHVRVGTKKAADGEVGDLEFLEKGLSASSCRRVNQRRRVFRGYADRSRRERTWDPGSAFYADGASRHYLSGPRGDGSRGETGGNCRVHRGKREGSVINGGQDKRYGRRRVSTEKAAPVDMDWSQIDTKRFTEVAEEMRAALEGDLFTVVTSDDSGVGKLKECFGGVQNLLEAAGQLLGWPQSMRERFQKKFGMDCQIGNYVAMVSRLSLLWTATCGVLDILGMVGRRQELREAFTSGKPIPEDVDTNGVSTGVAGFDGAMADDDKRIEHVEPAAISVALPSNSQQNHVRDCQLRLEIAEYSLAIGESIKLWVAYVPWPVHVLHGGEDMLSRLGAEEEALPWPPEFEPEAVGGLDPDTNQAGVSPDISPLLIGPQPRCDSGEEETFGEGVVAPGVKEERWYSRTATDDTATDDSEQRAGKCDDACVNVVDGGNSTGGLAPVE